MQELTMRAVMLTYACIYLLILLANACYWIKYKGRIAILLYELLSGCYLTTLIVVYFSPELFKTIPLWAVLPAAVLIIFEFYISVWGDVRRFAPQSEALKLADREVEFARVASVIFAAPAYLTAMLLLVEIWNR